MVSTKNFSTQVCLARNFKLVSNRGRPQKNPGLPEKEEKYNYGNLFASSCLSASFLVKRISLFTPDMTGADAAQNFHF